MRFKQAEDDASAVICTGLREEWEVTDGEFEVPDDVLTADMRERLVGAGHTPLDESGESGDSRASNQPEGDTSSEENASASEQEANESGSMTADRLTGEDGEETESSVSPDDLDEMDRSELYSFGNEELDLDLQWSGDDALNTEEMRERIRSEL